MTTTDTISPATSADLPAEVGTVIVGGGFSGLAAAIQLSRSGDEDYLVIERQDDLGGTWNSNTYPGVQCDIPSHLYSFSFALNPDWSKLFSDGAEIHRYQKDVADREGVTEHFRFSTTVQAARWNEDQDRWEVETDRGTVISRFLVMATGHLADTQLPDVTGIETFSGPAFHSARWRDDVDLAGKRVGVVGTGATAVQLVPALADQVGELVVFQRTPGWVLPRHEHDFTEVEKSTLRRNPDALRSLRDEIFQQRENLYMMVRGVEPFAGMAKQMGLEHLKNQVPDDALRAQLTPSFEPGCKRVLLSNRYYPALQKENVTLEASALASVNGSTVTAVSGHTYELDVLIFATGFAAGEPPYSELVYGLDGVKLADHWARGMQAMDSCAIAQYPNLFTINGPNAALGHNSIIYIVESQVQYMLDAMAYAKAHGEGAVLLPKREVEDAYVERMTEISQDTVLLNGGCQSWYLDPRSGRQTLVWPETAADFRATNVFTPEHFDLKVPQPA